MDIALQCDLPDDSADLPELTTGSQPAVADKSVSQGIVLLNVKLWSP